MARDFGYVDVERMLQSMSAKQRERWRVLYDVEAREQQDEMDAMG